MWLKSDVGLQRCHGHKLCCGSSAHAVVGTLWSREPTGPAKWVHVLDRKGIPARFRTRLFMSLAFSMTSYCSSFCGWSQQLLVVLDSRTSLLLPSLKGHCKWPLGTGTSEFDPSGLASTAASSSRLAALGFGTKSRVLVLALKFLHTVNQTYIACVFPAVFDSQCDTCLNSLV